MVVCTTWTMAAVEVQATCMHSLRSAIESDHRTLRTCESSCGETIPIGEEMQNNDVAKAPQGQQEHCLTVWPSRNRTSRLGLARPGNATLPAWPTHFVYPIKYPLLLLYMISHCITAHHITNNTHYSPHQYNPPWTGYINTPTPTPPTMSPQQPPPPQEPTTTETQPCAPQDPSSQPHLASSPSSAPTASPSTPPHPAAVELPQSPTQSPAESSIAPLTPSGQSPSSSPPLPLSIPSLPSPSEEDGWEDEEKEDEQELAPLLHELQGMYLEIHFDYGNAVALIRELEEANRLLRGEVKELQEALIMEWKSELAEAKRELEEAKRKLDGGVGRGRVDGFSDW
ncbi:hypothetical protein DFH27DRAFT_600230 [Peziza echinospora]|nr:hypothetical protein DFH27DRAFT_600230 [Peziza echinospora]